MRTITLLLLLVFSMVITVQYHHQHHDESEVHMVSGKTLLKKAVHCKICEHFIHHKHTLINESLAHFSFGMMPQPAVLGGIHLSGKYSVLVQHFSNKGPPVLA